MCYAHIFTHWTSARCKTQKKISFPSGKLIFQRPKSPRVVLFLTHWVILDNRCVCVCVCTETVLWLDVCSFVHSATRCFLNASIALYSIRILHVVVIKLHRTLQNARANYCTKQWRRIKYFIVICTPKVYITNPCRAINECIFSKDSHIQTITFDTYACTIPYNLIRIIRRQTSTRFWSDPRPLQPYCNGYPCCLYTCVTIHECRSTHSQWLLLLLTTLLWGMNTDTMSRWYLGLGLNVLKELFKSR